MPIRTSALRLLLLAGVLALLAGCTHVERTVEPGRDPAALGEVFVVSNLADNHRLAERIAAALRERGLRSAHGPATMAPEGAQALLRYEDRWTWDFGEHMIYLRLELHDPGANRPYASAYRLRHIDRSTDVDAAVKALVSELMRPATTD